MNSNITKIIDRYLAGELSPEEKYAFEEKMRSHPELNSEVELQQSIAEGAKRASQRVNVQQARRHYRMQKSIKWIGGSFGVFVIATLFVFYGLPYFQGAGEQEISETLIAELDKQAQIDDLATQYFAIPTDGNVVLSKKGVLLSVPKNAFLQNGKPYTGNTIVQFQEALDGGDIVKSGLSTMAGDRLLETQGMFGVQGFTEDGKPLEFNPKVGVYVQVPVDEYAENMQLFDGKKLANGVIDWVNPKPLEKIPVPVNMSELDFYPVGYETKLDELKWKTSKKSRDSLYLSFEETECVSEGGRTGSHSDTYVITKQPDKAGLKLTWNHYIDNPADEIRLHITLKIPDKWKVSSTAQNYKINNAPLNVSEISFGYDNDNSKYDFIGELTEISPENSIENKIKYRTTKSYSRYVEFQQKIKRKTSNSFTIIASVKLKYDQGDGVIRDLVQMIHFSVAGEKDNNDYAESSATASASCDGILPSNVLAFWKKEFNNTNLATREFERRMRTIHSTCDGAVLAKYTSNLTKSLSEIDREVVEMGYSGFKKYADENVGSVDINNPHLKGLQTFYDKGISSLKASAKKNQDAENKRKNKWDKSMQDDCSKEQSRKQKREATNLKEEYDFNLADVKRQLGYTKGFTIKHGGGTIKNIDAYVMEATIARTTTEITDPFTGKKAKITYNDFSFNVPNGEKYIKLYAYLFPHQLNSYQRIDGENGEFSYPLNNAIIYDIGIVGLTKDGYEYFQKQTFKGGKLGSVKMKKVTEYELEASVKQLNNKRNAKPMKINNEFQWLMKERKDYLEQDMRMKMAEFRRNLKTIVHPCTSSEVVAINVRTGQASSQ